MPTKQAVWPPLCFDLKVIEHQGKLAFGLGKFQRPPARSLAVELLAPPFQKSKGGPIYGQTQILLGSTVQYGLKPTLCSITYYVDFVGGHDGGCMIYGRTGEGKGRFLLAEWFRDGDALFIVGAAEKLTRDRLTVFAK